MAADEKVTGPVMCRAVVLLRGIKLPIVFMAMITSLAGFMGAAGGMTFLALAASASVALVSAGALLLNNVQDRDIDMVMERTRKRPLPSGELEMRTAIILSSIFIAAGLAGLIAAAGSLRGALLSLAALALYNLAYTSLKRTTPWAVIPGTLSGSMPLYIGWISGGGPFFSVPICVLMAVMSIWQVPHTWLTGLLNLDDYRRARIPVMASLMGLPSLQRLIFLWIFTFAASTLWIPVAGIAMSKIPALLVGINALALVLVFLRLMMLKQSCTDYRFFFNYLNISTGALFMIIIAGATG